jgi:predicted Zn-dependent protease
VVATIHLALSPVGRVDTEDLEAALARAARLLHRPLELREALPVPHGAEDVARGQHRAAALIARLVAEAPKLGPGRLIGAEDPRAKPPPRPEAWLFFTDLDLFTARTEGVIAALLPAERAAVLSVRRLREAFYRRRADPLRQRARVLKELLRLYGRLAGLPECSDPLCVTAPSRGAPDIDTKQERYCRACEQRLFEGRLLL